MQGESAQSRAVTAFRRGKDLIGGSSLTLNSYSESGRKKDKHCCWRLIMPGTISARSFLPVRTLAGTRQAVPETNFSCLKAHPLDDAVGIVRPKGDVTGSRA
jgi:hypothetical protein